MVLHIALKQIFDTYGTFVLEQGHLTAYLSDYEVFGDFDERKRICRIIDAEYAFNISQSLSKSTCKADIIKIEQDCIARHPEQNVILVHYIFDAILYGLSKKKSVTSPTINNVQQLSKKPSPIKQPQQKAQTQRKKKSNTPKRKHKSTQPLNPTPIIKRKQLYMLCLGSIIGVTFIILLPQIIDFFIEQKGTEKILQQTELGDEPLAEYDYECDSDYVASSSTSKEYNPKIKSHNEQTLPLDVVEVKNPHGYYYNGHEYVDLGLSVLWATHNIGAKQPQDVGAFFAWGETSPKHIYSFRNYKFYQIDTEGNTYVNKYCPADLENEYFLDGVRDNKTILDLNDDAAHITWGGGWRMPTKAERDELLQLMKWEDYEISGVKGAKIIGKNNNWIFVPYSGYKIDDELRGKGLVCWTSEKPEDYFDVACYFYTYLEEYEAMLVNRPCGLTIRPVHPK